MNSKLHLIAGASMAAAVGAYLYLRNSRNNQEDQEEDPDVVEIEKTQKENEKVIKKLGIGRKERMALQANMKQTDKLVDFEKWLAEDDGKEEQIKQASQSCPGLPTPARRQESEVPACSKCCPVA